MMPWFETPATNNGNWGQHWTMTNQNPNIVDASGRRQIASYYYPMIGPYASSDTNVIDYQLLLIKLSGLDGVFIDWSGTMNKYDYPKNVSNAEAMMNRLDKVGLKYAVVYEDHNLTLGGASNYDAQAQADMTYLKNNYFNRSSYVYVNSAPLLLDFGPQSITNPSDWTTVFSVLNPKPTFLPLWAHTNYAGSNSNGEFAWMYQSNTYLYNYYKSHNPAGTTWYGCSYIGYRDFYAAGGEGSGSGFTITPSLANFQQTLDTAFYYNLPNIQIATWNDYGEGTMMEPTREFGYGCLAYTQQKLGVSGITQADFKLVDTFYKQRVLYAGNSVQQSRLTQAFYYLVSLQLDSARSLLLGTQANVLPSPWKNTDVGPLIAPGSATYTSGIFSAKGSGGDIYGTEDAFQYVYQPISGNVSITAKVNSLDNTNAWAKAGLMIRENLSGNAANAAILITPSNGINFQYRNTTAGATTNAGGNTLTAPYWLRLTRIGNVFTSYYSADGNTWTQLGTVTVSMASTVYVGMALTSHSDGVLANAAFSNVAIIATPSITSFTPTNSVTGSYITIKGKFFTSTTSISFGGVAASSFTIVSDSVITAVVANAAPGSVSVTNSIGTAILAGFSYQLCPGGVATTLVSNLTGANYQWQLNTGSGFTNISNNSDYTGVTTAVLQLNNLATVKYGYLYQCIVDGTISNVYTLKFTDTWTGASSNAWENPANWSCGTVPDNNTDVIINSGTVVLSSNTSCRSITISPSVNFTVTAGNQLIITH